MLAGIGLGFERLRSMGDPLSTWAFRIPLALSVPSYLLAVWMVRRGARPSLGLVLGVAIGLRAVLLITPPLMSGDVFRYVWDGRVQNAGINPYLYLPVDPALAALRDGVIYPNINRADYAPTIYPPAAQALFAGVVALSDSVIAMKLAMVGLEAVAIACLLRLLRRTGQASAQVLIYAWNPTALWEFANNGHVDAAAVGLLALALLLRGSGVRDGLAGFAAGAAVLVKFLPAVVLPALWRRGGWALVAGFLLCVSALYGFYAGFGGAGVKVLGFLHGYGAEEGLDSGQGIWALAGLAMIAPLPFWAGKAYLALAAAGLLGLGAWIAFRARPGLGTAADVMRICADAGVLILAMMIALSPHYPWYFAWAALPAVIARNRAAIWLSCSAMLLYWSPSPDHFLWPSVVFLPAILLAAADLRARPVHILPGGL